jgi:hypothetical protein
MSDAGTDVAVWSPREVDTIKRLLAPGISDDDLALYAKVCMLLDLSPFRDEIVTIGRRQRDPATGSYVTVHRHLVTVQGRRVLAIRTGQLRGIVGPQWCGPHAPFADSPLVWHDVWLEDQPPHAARVFVYRDGWPEPVNGTAPWREFAQRDSNGRLVNLWAKMPAHMLGKVAEAMALRRAFPEALTGEVVSGHARPDEAQLLDADPYSGGGDAMAEAGIAPSQPSQPSPDHHPMTVGQVVEISGLLQRVGLREDRSALLAYVSTVVGRAVEDTRTLTHDEAEALAAQLRQDVSDLSAPDPEQPPQEVEQEGEEL